MGDLCLITEHKVRTAGEYLSKGNTQNLKYLVVKLQFVNLSYQYKLNPSRYNPQWQNVKINYKFTVDDGFDIFVIFT